MAGTYFFLFLDLLWNTPASLVCVTSTTGGPSPIGTSQIYSLASRLRRQPNMTFGMHEVKYFETCMQRRRLHSIYCAIALTLAGLIRA